MSKKSGDKFTERYDVESATIYKTADFSRVRIPGKDHVLYDPSAPVVFDPVRVAAIDRDGRMTTPIEVWSDPDHNLLWVVDGRGRFLDVVEVNRRRKKEGREPVKALLVPFNGDEKAAIARVREKNYHRRTPSVIGMAQDIVRLRAAGYGWAEIASILHHETEDAERWGKGLAPLAHCIAEVQLAIENGEFAVKMARFFGGTDPEGARKLGRQEQLRLLADLRTKKESQAVASKPPPRVSPAAAERVRGALGNGAAKDLEARDREVAGIVRATIARLAGDKGALADWPAVQAVVEKALAPVKKTKASQ